MRWLRRLFLSTQAMLILIAVFALSMAAATFIENDFGSLLMTYLGVNVYLSGLHSYAAGDRVPLQFWIYIVTIVIFVMVFLAQRKREMRIVTDR